MSNCPGSSPSVEPGNKEEVVDGGSWPEQPCCLHSRERQLARESPSHMFLELPRPFSACARSRVEGLRADQFMLDVVHLFLAITGVGRVKERVGEQPHRCEELARAQARSCQDLRPPAQLSRFTTSSMYDAIRISQRCETSCSISFSDVRYLINLGLDYQGTLKLHGNTMRYLSQRSSFHTGQTSRYTNPSRLVHNQI